MEWLGPFVGELLESFDYFSDVAVLLEDKGVVMNDVFEALGAVNEKSGKAGICLLVQCPIEEPDDANLPGPVTVGKITVSVIEDPLINRDTEAGGTGKPWPRVGRRVKARLHHFNFGEGKMLIFAGMERVILDNNAGNGADYTFKVQIGDPIIPKVIKPRISGPANAVQMECAHEGAAIYYTTDLSFPRPGGEFSHLYEAPIELDAGTVVYAAAYADSFQGSDLTTKTIT